MVPNTKIDPLFSDHLQISIFNASAKPIEVTKGMGFCAAYFQTVEYDIPWSASRGALAINVQRRNRFVEFLQANTANIATILIAILGAAAATLATLYFNEAHKAKASAAPQQEQRTP
ncbi:MAG: dCTP deaminase [Verrucomicrobiota bacterium]